MTSTDIYEINPLFVAFENELPTTILHLIPRILYKPTRQGMEFLFLIDKHEHFLRAKQELRAKSKWRKFSGFLHHFPSCKQTKQVNQKGAKQTKK